MCRMTKCKECKHFKIIYPPLLDYDSGLAKCRKHDLYVEWLKKRELNKMVCVEEKECAE